MHEKNYDIKTKGTSKDKLYQYHMRYIFGVNIEDLIALIGPVAAARLLHFYGGTCMYIPAVKTVRKKMNEVLLKKRCIHLLREGKSRNAITEQLLKEGIGYSRNTLKMKMVRWFGESTEKDKFMFKDVASEQLVQMIAENYDLFRSYRIL
ncbi:MAG: hypothetical protein ACLPX5_12525 [Dissulfurispiraceae bacterium]